MISFELKTESVGPFSQHTVSRHMYKYSCLSVSGSKCCTVVGFYVLTVGVMEL